MTSSTTPRVPVFSLGERIHKARKDLGLSQQEFADMLGVDRKTVGNWESERVQIRYGDLMLISSAADVDLSWLAGEHYRPEVSNHSNRECLNPTRPYGFENNGAVDPRRVAQDEAAELLQVA